jgi:hypothetical protein
MTGVFTFSDRNVAHLNVYDEAQRRELQREDPAATRRALVEKNAAAYERETAAKRAKAEQEQKKALTEKIRERNEQIERQFRFELGLSFDAWGATPQERERVIRLVENNFPKERLNLKRYEITLVNLRNVIG